MNKHGVIEGVIQGVKRKLSPGNLIDRILKKDQSEEIEEQTAEFLKKKKNKIKQIKSEGDES